MYTCKSITALILAGGLGLRLRSVVKNLPKVLAPINKRPFLSYLLDQLIAAGCRDVILCTGYLGNKVRDTFGDQYKRITIAYSQEQEPLGTGGALFYAMPLISTETVLVMNGDSYIDTDLSPFFARYFENDQNPSLLLTRKSDTSRYGRVAVDNVGRIIAFEEKKPNAGPGWINAGIYIFKKHLIYSIFPQKRFSLEREFFPNLIGKELYGFQCDASFIDIGTPKSLARAKDFFYQR
jgi:NDP-sugar pyrophosphorylase family protein